MIRGQTFSESPQSYHTTSLSPSPLLRQDSTALAYFLCCRFGYSSNGDLLRQTEVIQQNLTVGNGDSLGSVGCSTRPDFNQSLQAAGLAFLSRLLIQKLHQLLCRVRRGILAVSIGSHLILDIRPRQFFLTLLR